MGGERILEMRLEWALIDAIRPQRGAKGEGSPGPSRISISPEALWWQKPRESGNPGLRHLLSNTD